MNRDCASTRKSLRKYLTGHLFKFEQVRIARHLNACPVCRSEFQALQKVADTRQLLKDITPPEGVSQRMKAGAAGLSKFKLLIYRPLWMVLLLAAFTLLYVNLVSQRRDVEIENIEKTIPAAAAVASAPTVTAETIKAAVQPPPPADKAVVQPAAPSDPLVVTITPQDEQALGRINDVMGGHRELRKLKFSDDVREVAGSLTEQELQTFVGRIGEAAKVSYSRKKIQSFPVGQPIPFVLKVRSLPKAAERPLPASTPASTPAAAPGAAVAAGETRPAEEPVKKPDQQVSGQ